MIFLRTLVDGSFSRGLSTFTILFAILPPRNCGSNFQCLEYASWLSCPLSLVFCTSWKGECCIAMNLTLLWKTFKTTKTLKLVLSILTTGTTRDHTTFPNQQLDVLSQGPLRVQTAHCMRSHPVESKHPDHACSNIKLPPCSTSSRHLLYMHYQRWPIIFNKQFSIHQFNCLKLIPANLERFLLAWQLQPIHQHRRYHPWASENSENATGFGWLRSASDGQELPEIQWDFP